MSGRLWTTAFFALMLATPAIAQSGVQVHIPSGIRTGFTTVAPASEGRKYVVVENVVVRNPSPYSSVVYRLDDFSLVVGEHRYHPTPRPKLGAIDLSSNGSLGPRASLRTNLSFLVPGDIVRASLEFTPAGWEDEYGLPVLYCCIP